MRISTKQARKSYNANTITTLHERVAGARKNAATLFQLAKEARDDARAMTKQIKALSKEQSSLKRELKGAPKRARPVKADTRWSLEAGQANMFVVDNTVGVTPAVLRSPVVAEFAAEQLSNLG